MCYPCRNCGKCKKKYSLETCAMCGYENVPGVVICNNCGFKFPPKPGIGKRKS